MDGILSEEELMAAYAKGDRLAFSKLFQILAPVVHGFFMRRFSGDMTLADDLLQTTFLKLHRARERYRPGAPVRPWVFTIAARVRLDELRKRRRSVEDANTDQIDRMAQGQGLTQSNQSEQVENMDMVKKVRAALEELPESQRVVIVLHRYQGMTFDEIATVLGTSEGAIKLRAFRAYERLRKCLAPILQQQIFASERGQTGDAELTPQEFQGNA